VAVFFFVGLIRCMCAVRTVHWAAGICVCGCFLCRRFVQVLA
jgi:hypothetical protein